ncbi:MAG: glycosyltransferase family 4 protein [Thermoanaerobaculia bacterium]
MVTRRQLRGAEVFAGQLAGGLAARGHAVVLAALYAPGEPPLEPEGVEITDLGAHRSRGLSPGLLGSTAAFLRAWRPDVVQANGSDTLKYLVLARRLVRDRTPLVYRNISLASAWLRGPVHRTWNRWLAGQAAAVAAVSAASARDFGEVHRLPPERIETIPIGTPVPERLDREGGRRRLEAVLDELRSDVKAEVRAALNRDPAVEPPRTSAGPGSGSREAGSLRGPVLLHAGSFTPEKDHATLLRAFARVAERHREARLVLAGDGPLRREIEALAGSLGLNGRVLFLGARRNLSAWMAGADLLVLPSRIEGVPGVVLEAAARGLPVVATAVGSVPDAVVDGTTGLLVPPGDPEALAGALEQLLADGELRSRMGAAGREHVRHCFALDRIVERFEKLYRRLAGGIRG